MVRQPKRTPSAGRGKQRPPASRHSLTGPDCGVSFQRLLALVQSARKCTSLEEHRFPRSCKGHAGWQKSFKDGSRVGDRAALERQSMTARDSIASKEDLGVDPRTPDVGT